jgi:hypothetical protein
VTLALYAALALTGWSCPGRKATYEARFLGASLACASAGKHDDYQVAINDDYGSFLTL